MGRKRVETVIFLFFFSVCLVTRRVRECLFEREGILFRAKTFVCQVNHSVYNVPGFLRRIGVFAFATAFVTYLFMRCASIFVFFLDKHQYEFTDVYLTFINNILQFICIFYELFGLLFR